ncbi:mechanosensitive ion channel [Synechococcales cyanobacterium C]|uniref:Mechanosensitive ion channel n=1 Tax=Petrachloros mirabilis ULC683 TaxID=2781853 RepID=A0A8K2A9R7_9CYAN|nr:mechanosensitive ion channel family protein [Petrachloros mirabilis]NCJ08470.1 mechanosensitive ion channel [Petrachloros mirabilis ULC683]
MRTIIAESVSNLLRNAIEALPGLVIAVVVLWVTRILAHYASRIVKGIVQRTVRTHSLQLLFTKSTFILVWVCGLVIACIAAFPDVNIGDFVAALGLGSVAIGFAFQDIFKNFLAGVLLLLQEPFRIGDQIIVDGLEGTVEEISFRSTQIRTYLGERILVPNATVFTTAVQVRTAYDYRRTDLAVGVDYNTPLPKAAQLLQQTITGVEGVLAEPPPEVDLVSFGDSSIDFIVRYWTRPKMQKVRQTQTRAIVAIKKALDLAEISIPYPIRTLYFYNQQRFEDSAPKALEQTEKVS